MQEIVKILTKQHKTISIMESCTGGFVSNDITNQEGASQIFKFSAITYSNQFKIKMGVDNDIIEKYGVYSKEVSQSMAKAISSFTNSNYAIGITGKLNREDYSNLSYDNNKKVYISIYNSDNNKCYDFEIIVKNQDRVSNKKMVLNKIILELKNII